jgi:hypothetical protein
VRGEGSTIKPGLLETVLVNISQGVITKIFSLSKVYQLELLLTAGGDVN